MFQNPTYVTVLKNFHSSVSLLNSAGFAFKMFKSSILPKPYVHNVSGRFFFVFLSRWDLHRKQEKLSILPPGGTYIENRKNFWVIGPTRKTEESD